MAPGQNLNQWFIVNWINQNKRQGNLNWNTKLFIYETAFGDIVCEMAAVLSRGRWVNFCSHSSEFPPFPGLWLVEQFLYICRQTVDQIELKFCGPIHYRLPLALWTFGHAPLNPSSDLIPHPTHPPPPKKQNQLACFKCDSELQLQKVFFKINRIVLNASLYGTISQQQQDL